jgi:hypothetical protein
VAGVNVGLCGRGLGGGGVDGDRPYLSLLGSLGDGDWHGNLDCDARAINLKLNELIRAMGTARNQLIDIERLSDLELDEMQTTYEKIKTSWTERQARAKPGPQSEGESSAAKDK